MESEEATNVSGNIPDEPGSVRGVFADLMARMPAELLPPEPGSPRGKILRAARKLFAERGYDRTGTRAIAGEAGVNLAMIHYYFGTKRGLYKRTLIYNVIQFFSLMHRRLSLKQAPEEVVVTFPLAFLETVRFHPDLAGLMRREIAAGGETIGEIIREIGEFGPKGFRRYLGGLYTRAVEQGRMREFPADSVLRMLIGSGWSIVFFAPFLELVTGKSLEDEEEWRTQVETIEEVLKYGLFREGEG